jgi:hypothetical protein
VQVRMPTPVRVERPEGRASHPGKAVGGDPAKHLGAIVRRERQLEIVLEYGPGVLVLLDHLPGFQRRMDGGSYGRALANIFLPEFLSMNLLMSAIVLVASLGWSALGGEPSPLAPEN